MSFLSLYYAPVSLHFQNQCSSLDMNPSLFQAPRESREGEGEGGEKEGDWGEKKTGKKRSL